MTDQNNDQDLRLWSNNNFILTTHKILRKILWNPWNIYAWIKHHSRRWFIDGFFWKKYFYVSNEWYLEAKKFYEYFVNENYYNSLIKWLDSQSIQLINKYFSKVNYIVWNRDLCLPMDLLRISDNVPSEKIRKNINEYAKRFHILGKQCPEVRFYKHGINNIPNISNYSKWKDIIDCWAFIWDSAFMLNNELDINKIFSLEPDPQNYKELIKLIKKNKKQDKIIPIKIWVWSKKQKLKFNSWNGSASKIEEQWEFLINIDLIDNIVEENYINPWIIKRDIEWAEYDSLLWAEKTIKKYKPILIISIYHTPKDFFEIKPLIESRNLWYNFKIVHCEEATSYCEIMLLAYIE